MGCTLSHSEREWSWALLFVSSQWEGMLRWFLHAPPVLCYHLELFSALRHHWGLFTRFVLRLSVRVDGSAKPKEGGRDEKREGDHRPKERKERERRPSIDIDDHSKCCEPAPPLLSPGEVKTATVWKHPKLQPNAYGCYAVVGVHKGSRHAMEDRHRSVPLCSCASVFVCV